MTTNNVILNAVNTAQRVSTESMLSLALRLRGQKANKTKVESAFLTAYVFREVTNYSFILKRVKIYMKMADRQIQHVTT